VIEMNKIQAPPAIIPIKAPRERGEAPDFLDSEGVDVDEEVVGRETTANSVK